MPIVHVVIGDANSRKSSTLRCLTGYEGKKPLQKVIQIAIRAGQPIDAVARLSSLQEMPKAFLTPSAFVQTVKRLPKDVQCVIALRVFGTRYCMHHADKYLDRMRRARFTVQHIALLGTAACSQRSTYASYCPNATILAVPPRGGHPTREPSNAIAGRIRRLWGWQ